LAALWNVAGEPHFLFGRKAVAKVGFVGEERW
jgi:hypothetical protein